MTLGDVPELETMEELISELQLGSARGGKRRAEEPVNISVVRKLTEADLPTLKNPPPLGSTPSIPELRHQHHQLAGLLAKGIPNAEISLITGYSPSFISTLRNAPDMQELIAYYAGMAEERTVDALARLRQLGISAVEELQQRVNVEPEKFTPGQLMELTELGLIKPIQAAAAGRTLQGNGASGGIQISLNFKAPEVQKLSDGPGTIIEALPREAAE